MTLTAWLMGIALLLGLPGLALLWSAVRGEQARIVRGLLGALLLVLGLSLGGLAGLLRNYLWLLEDQPVATVSIRQIAAQRYMATLAPEGAESTKYPLSGDQWLLDAQVIRWHLPAALAGLPPVYRLERLSGRYSDPSLELSAQRTVHDLRQDWDFWQFQQRYLSGLAIADSHWGSAAYMPMIDGARFTVLINPRGGLVAKPADAHSEELLREAGW